ncbi:lipoyl synthase, mitochondrial [Cryptococcus gattii EJB2]|uniref:Lipoyl synthase, mitochondrial n=1 Tax=Cryptococcus gattii EJB2 TaxID=1296103 RepID=A0ABR5BZF7_9TREE|nr:lipoyl synthase, mitochondrial [Cryptococcus gattii EJB2]KJD99657.1 lipoyl synthase, mitochondrial [Cryptococcus gattii NT-10]
MTWLMAVPPISLLPFPKSSKKHPTFSLKPSLPISLQRALKSSIPLLHLVLMSLRIMLRLLKGVHHSYETGGQGSTRV